VAERQQPDIADQQVEGAGEQREAQRLGQEHGIELERRHQRQRQQRRVCEDFRSVVGIAKWLSR
jgi:hypothetical protein